MTGIEPEPDVSEPVLCVECGSPGAVRARTYSVTSRGKPETMKEIEARAEVIEVGPPFCGGGCMVLHNAKEGSYPAAILERDSGSEYDVVITLRPRDGMALEREWLLRANDVIIAMAIEIAGSMMRAKEGGGAS